MRRAIPAAIVLSLFVATQGFAAPSPGKRALIVELMRLSNTHALGVGYLMQILSVAAPEVPEEQRRQMHSQLSATPEARQMTEESFVAIYDKTFTEAELRQLIAFFKTDLGRKYANLNLQIGTEGRGAIAGKTASALSESLHLSKVKRTMADMRSIGTASEAYATDENRYPDAKTIGALESILEPTYIRDLPRRDAWGNEFAFIRRPDTFGYRIVSCGPDGRVEPESLVTKSKPEKSDDIIYEDGSFLRDPLATAK